MRCVVLKQGVENYSRANGCAFTAVTESNIVNVEDNMKNRGTFVVVFNCHEAIDLP